MSTYKPGDFIKVEFLDETATIGERMWVRIEYCDDEIGVVFGRLDSEPVLEHAGKLKLDSQVAISYDNVLEYRETSKL